MPTGYPRSQRLRGHTIFENLKKKFFLLLSFIISFFIFSKVKKFAVCQHSQHPYADTMSAESTTALTQCQRGQQRPQTRCQHSQ